MASISKIQVNGETYDISGGGDSKIVHGSFGVYEGVELTGAGMIILCGDNARQNVYSFCGQTASLIVGNNNNYSFESTADGIKFYDNYDLGTKETLYTIIYV